MHITSVLHVPLYVMPMYYMLCISQSAMPASTEEFNKAKCICYAFPLHLFTCQLHAIYTDYTFITCTLHVLVYVTCSLHGFCILIILSRYFTRQLNVRNDSKDKGAMSITNFMKKWSLQKILLLLL